MKTLIKIILFAFCAFAVSCGGSVTRSVEIRYDTIRIDIPPIRDTLNNIFEDSLFLGVVKLNAKNDTSIAVTYDKKKKDFNIYVAPKRIEVPVIDTITKYEEKIEIIETTFLEKLGYALIGVVIAIVLIFLIKIKF